MIFDDRTRYLDRFGWLLSLVAATIVLASLVHLPHASDTITNIGVILLSVLGCLYLLLALHAAGVSRRWRRPIEILIAVVITLQVGGGVLILGVGDRVAAPQFNIPPLGALLFACLSFALVVHRVLRHRHVTAATMKGAITGFLLIPVAFFNLYLTLQILLPDPFFAGQGEASPEFMYYSLTTVTTLGGSLEAASPLGRLLTAVEAIVGQLYLVVFVALIVGLMAGRWATERAADDQNA